MNVVDVVDDYCLCVCLLSEYGAGVPSNADDSLRRQPALPQLPSRLQWTLSLVQVTKQRSQSDQSLPSPQSRQETIHCQPTDTSTGFTGHSTCHLITY